MNDITPAVIRELLGQCKWAVLCVDGTPSRTFLYHNGYLLKNVVWFNLKAHGNNGPVKVDGERFMVTGDGDTVCVPIMEGLDE